MSTTHTPGPWIIEKSDGFTRGHWIHDNKGEFVALAVMRRSSQTEETANSRLIVAAPDLLSAAEALVSLFDGCYSDRKTKSAGSITFGELNALREAIRKATTP